MGKINVETCEIEGLKVITPTVFGDERGYFMETYSEKEFAAAQESAQLEVVDDYNAEIKEAA